MSGVSVCLCMPQVDCPVHHSVNVERLAEALSWTSGEFTRYDPDAHPDHNRWSWHGDGHGEAAREGFREQARQVIAALGGGE